MTNWTDSTVTATQWSSTALSQTGFNGREIVKLGAIMDDTVYLMDDSVCTIDDLKLQTFVAPATTWI